MKKITFLLIAMLGISSISNAKKNTQWLNFTNGDNIMALADEGNTLWVGTYVGLVALDKNTGTPVFYNESNSGLPVNFILSITIDEDGTKWIGTYGGGLTAYNENGIPDYIETFDLPDNRINIFPNPATGKVAINMLDNISVLKIEVVNMHGNVIKSKIVATGQPVIDVYNLPAGFYILKIYTENGTVTKN